MIARLALNLATHFSEKNIYDPKEINVYKYGFELLISTLINFTGIFLIALIMSNIPGAVLFCAAFVPLRLSAGGYHAKHHWSCILGFNTIFLVFSVFHQHLNTDFVLPYSLAAVMVSSILIWSLSPVEAVNKPLSSEQKERQRNRSIIIASFNIAMTLLFYLVSAMSYFTAFLGFYISGALAASLSLVAAVITNGYDSPNETAV